MNKTKILLLALAGFALTSCVADTVDEPQSSVEVASSAKLVNTTENAIDGELIVYLDEQGAEQLLAGGTRSSFTAFNEAIDELGVTAVEPVFNLKVNAKQKRELGMHRWFTVKFPEEVDLMVAANRIADIKEVKSVEFATRVSTPKAQFEEAPMAAPTTRSSMFPFNDERITEQWHYYNDGTVKFPKAVAGADINLLPAWELTAGRKEVIVAVVDEGVCYIHEDIEPDEFCNFNVPEAALRGLAKRGSSLAARSSFSFSKTLQGISISPRISKLFG